MDSCQTNGLLEKILRLSPVNNGAIASPEPPRLGLTLLLQMNSPVMPGNLSYPAQSAGYDDAYFTGASPMRYNQVANIPTPFVVMT